MSNQPNSIVNGPYTDYNATFKDEIINKEMPAVQQNKNGSQQPFHPVGQVNPQRPLTRIDSTSSFPFRPPFPNQPGAPVRPGPVRQPVPPGTQQYIQRNPVPGPGQRPQNPQQVAQNRASYRPVTPFPRAPVQNQRPLFQQRSVPAFATQRPQILEEGLYRSQTLDTTEIDHSKVIDDKNTTNGHVKAPSIAAMNNRSLSLSSNHPDQDGAKEDSRRRSVSSVDSAGEGRPGSRQGSISDSGENMDKKENDVPSRPESRATSRMNKIIEDDDRSPSSLTDISQKSPDLSITSDKSQPTNKTTESNSINKSDSPKPLSPTPADKPESTKETLASNVNDKPKPEVNFVNKSESLKSETPIPVKETLESTVKDKTKSESNSIDKSESPKSQTPIPVKEILESNINDKPKSESNSIKKSESPKSQTPIPVKEAVETTAKDKSKSDSPKTETPVSKSPSPKPENNTAQMTPNEKPQSTNTLENDVTNEQKPQTPTPKSQTPTPKSQTPTPKSQTPTPKSQSPAPKSPSPNLKSPTTKSQPPTPKSPSPNLKSPSPKLQSPGFQSKEPPPVPSPKVPKSPGPQPRSPKDKSPSPQPTKSYSPNQNANKVVGEKPKEERPEKLLNLEKPPISKSPAKSEGDNDSGVDESTQGNDRSSNGEHRSPRKSTKCRTSSTTPTTRSLSRGSKSPSLKSPDSNATTPGSATEKKKVPMNKVQVGSAPSPNLKVVKSKIGSLDNASYKPGGGKVKIETKKLDFKAAAPRIEAKNERYVPKGGEKKIVQQKLHWNAKSKVGSLDNAAYKPKGGDKKIESVKLDFKEKAKPKVGSKDNIKHQPGGGEVKSHAVSEDKDTGNEKKSPKEIETKKIELNVSSKVGSLDNVKHKPGGGERKIFDDKDYLKQKTSADHSLYGSQNSLPSQPDANRVPVADENLNQEH